MDFDFYQQFKDYPNVELLKIVKQPENYQAAAVLVADTILKERAVTPEDNVMVEEYFENIVNVQEARTQKVNAVKDKLVDFFEPVLKPNEKVELRKWMNMLILAIGLQYAWILFIATKSLIRNIRCGFCDLYFYPYVFTLIYLPVIVYLVLKRKRWGWILLFADNLITFIFVISDVEFYFSAMASSFIFSILIRGGLLFFLWREPVTGYFRVSARTRMNTTLIGIAAALLYLFALRLLI